jgi:hypothetical protein
MILPQHQQRVKVVFANDSSYSLNFFIFQSNWFESYLYVTVRIMADFPCKS